MPTQNRQVRLAARPDGVPGDDVWNITEEPVAEPGDGQVHVQNLYISVDPAMRGWMNDARSYVPPVGLGEVMRALTVGRVVASADDRFAPGDHVSGVLGVQEHAVVGGDELRPVDTSLAALPTHLGVLGISGMTAYFGLLDIGAPKEGDTVVVSGAAGSVGMVVGQIAKLKGCHVVGIAGSAEKCAWVTDELGFDACVDYRGGNLRKDLRAAAPKGIDIYFDNVGGEILDLALAQLRLHARVVICGAISRYNDSTFTGPANYMSLLINRARMEGFVIFDYADRYAEAAKDLAAWLAEGRVTAEEDVVEGGVDAFPEALRTLFSGGNTGKLVLKVGE